MKKNVGIAAIALCCLGMLMSPYGTKASWFESGPKDTDEITPLQYSALLGLRTIDAEMFRKKLLPLISEAMQDGKITVAECKEIEKAAGNVAPAFFVAAKTPTLQESFNETMEKAQKEGKNFGSKLEDTLNNDVPKMFDDAINLFRNQLNQYKKENPQPPTNL